MRPAQTIATLTDFENRGAGTDAERRAAQWLAEQVATANREAQTETFWCRPNWALAHAWHVALAVAGSLVAESQPRVGVGLLAVALLSLLADVTTGRSLGRRLTPERASQNIVSEEETEPSKVHLILTANYDAGRTGLIYRGPLRAAAARLARATGRIPPGWQGWLAIAMAALIVIAVLRLENHRGTVIGVIQLVPTVGLVAVLALLLEQASASYGPAANDNASGAAAALALVQALDAAPPRNLAVDLVLEGAGDGSGLGFRHHLVSRRQQRKAPNTVVVGIAACGAGRPRWFQSDGALLPLGYFRELCRMCEAAVRQDLGLDAAPHRGRGHDPAAPARQRRLPAIALGCLDDRGLASCSHQLGDTPGTIDTEAIDRAVEFGLLLVDAIDAFVGRRAAAAPTPA